MRPESEEDLTVIVDGGTGGVHGKWPTAPQVVVNWTRRVGGID